MSEGGREGREGINEGGEAGRGSAWREGGSEGGQGARRGEVKEGKQGHGGEHGVREGVQ